MPSTTMPLLTTPRENSISERAKVAVIMRSHNDIDLIEGTLEALKRQTFRDFELWNHDSSSCDGTLKVILANNDPSRVLVNDPATYNPARVLNKAVSLCDNEIIVFLNSDATPISDTWLADLIAPLLGDKIQGDMAEEVYGNVSGSTDKGFVRKVGATFGRQSARSNCRPLFIKDTERAFGDGRISASWLHFFSMANSAAHRSTLVEFPFEPQMQYSEDIEWSKRLKQAGYSLEYVAAAEVCHSHNYSLRESWKRHFGEGKAEALIFSCSELNTSFGRYVLLPLVSEIVRDGIFSLRRFSIDGLLHSVPLRTAQKIGRWQGLRAGLRARVNGAAIANSNTHASLEI
jgi:rhamnosyltransferase